MKKNIFILFIFVIVVFSLLWNREKNDMIASNNYFHYIKKNTECLSYLQTINQIPVWRLSIIYSLFIALANSLVVSYVLHKKKQNNKLKNVSSFSSNETFWFIIVSIIIINFIGIYKIITHWNWHYMCDWGCSKLPLNKWKNSKLNLANN
tara:strand:- start:246 stop:695 length:450 start_codon:yes stop_codon:yes gene_type:complete